MKAFIFNKVLFNFSEIKCITPFGKEGDARCVVIIFKDGKKSFWIYEKESERLEVIKMIAQQLGIDSELIDNMFIENPIN